MKGPSFIEKGYEMKQKMYRVIAMICIVLMSVMSYRNEVSAEEGKLNSEVVQPEVLHYVDAHGEWHDMIIDPTVEKHIYKWSCLVNNEAGIAYAGDSLYTIRHGVDVSAYQGDIDWGKVKNAGYDFAIIRIAYRGYGREGKLCLDKKYLQNIINAKTAGLDVGVYIFSQAVNEIEAVEEAEFVLSALQGAQLDLPIVFDPELIKKDTARTGHVSGEQFTRNTIAFCNRVKSAGYDAMVYSNMFWEAELFDMAQLGDYPFWYADYEKIPQTPYHFTCWQYTEKGHVDGISGNVDLNVWFKKVTVQR